MESEFECYQHAAKCEQMAKDAPTEADRKFLLHAACQWKLRGKDAASAEKAASISKDASKE